MLGGVIGRAQKIIQNYFHTALRIPFFMLFVLLHYYD